MLKKGNIKGTPRGRSKTSPQQGEANARQALERLSKSELIDALIAKQMAPCEPAASIASELDSLREALDVLPRPFSLFDPDDKCLFVNQAYREMNLGAPGAIKRGMTYSTHLKKLLDAGLIPAAKGREKAWYKKRLEHHRNPSAPLHQARADGTEFQILEKKLTDGCTVITSENVTAQKQTDQALRESEKARALLSSAIDEISEGIALFDKADRLVLANKSWWQMSKAVIGITKLGTTFEQHLRNCIAAGLLQDAIGREEEWIATRMAQHQNPGAPIELARANGRINLINEQQLSEGGCILVILDITEQKRLQVRLEEAVESIEDAFILFDEEGRLVLSNSKFREFFPAVADQLKPGTSFEALFRTSVKQGTHKGKTQDDEAFIKSRMEEFFLGESVAERKLSDGRWVLVSDRRTQSGEIVGIRTDITQLKQREEEVTRANQLLLDAIESISEGFVLFDANEELVLCNSKFKELYAVVEDLLVPGARYRDLIVEMVERKGVILQGMTAEQWIEKRQRQFSSPDEVQHHQMSDGRWIKLYNRPTKSGGLVGIRTDITDIVNAEMASRQAVAAAERANKAKSDFLANMSHELRTPLNAIIGFSSVISKELYGPIPIPTYSEYATDIQSSGEHLLTLISDLLDISKIEAGALTLDKTALDVGGAVRRCLRMVESVSKSKNIRLRTNLRRDLPDIFADARHFSQILLNVLSNAVKFTPAGGEILITGRIGSKGRVSILIKDSGIGIEPENIDRILEPFGQVADSSTRSHEGAGLGLSIVKSLVEMHDGELKVRSKPGQGTVVEILMPIYH